MSAESRTRAVLDESVRASIVEARSAPPALFAADGTPHNMSAYHFGRLLRRLRILRWLDRFRFDSLVDVASGFDCYPFLARQRYGVDAYYSDMVHRVNMPFGGPWFGRLDRAVTLQLPRLPFRDDAFDVVLCSEVLEHLVRPVEALAELLRVARKYVIVTSLEALSTNRWERWRSHVTVDVTVPHAERNFFLLSDFHALFGADLLHEPLQGATTLPANPFVPAAQQAAAYAGLDTRVALEAALCRALTTAPGGRSAMGIVLVKARPGAVVAPPTPESDAELATWLIDLAVREEEHVRRTLAMAGSMRERFPADLADAIVRRPVSESLRTRLCCPDCRGELAPQGVGLRCTTCAQRFGSQFGVPILYPTRPPDDSALGEAVDRLCGSDGRRRKTVNRLAARLRRAEHPPDALRRFAARVARRGRANSE
ncbi:MAG: methyltransferase domain-containing protein [bacterium]